MIKNAKDALEVFERNSLTVEQILEHVESCARDNWRHASFEGWPSDAVIAELRKLGFKVVLSDHLIPNMKVYW